MAPRGGSRAMVLRSFSSAGGEIRGSMAAHHHHQYHHVLWLLQASPYLSGHYTCHVCWEKGSGPLFHCADCQFDVHVSCAGGGVGATQTHFSHFQHPLLLNKYSTSTSADEVVCDGCGESHRGRNPQIYRCSHCDFDLCVFCVQAPRFLLHVSHSHILNLSTPDDLGGICQCDGCGQPARGMMYKCTCCNFDLHVSCTRLPLKPIHALHPDHPLTLVCREEDTWQSSYTCNACGHEGQGWHYTCSLCRFYLHPYCAKVDHDIPNTSFSTNHVRNIEPKVPQRANSLQLGSDNYHIPRSMSINSPSLLTRNTSNNPFNRSYSSSSSFGDPLSPYPNSSRNFSTTSFDRMNYKYSSPRNIHEEAWNENNIITTNTIAHALSSRLTPMSPRDAEAIDRVVSMLRHNGSPPYI